MTGPFQDERQAREAAQQYTGPPGASLTGPPGQLADANQAMLLDACNAAGVELGEFDARIVAWLAGWERSTVAVVAGLISRAGGQPVPAFRPMDTADAGPETGE